MAILPHWSISCPTGSRTFSPRAFRRARALSPGARNEHFTIPNYRTKKYIYKKKNNTILIASKCYDMKHDEQSCQLLHRNSVNPEVLQRNHARNVSPSSTLKTCGIMVKRISPWIFICFSDFRTTAFISLPFSAAGSSERSK